MDDNKYSRRQFIKKGLAATGSGVVLGGAASNALAATQNSIVTENLLTGNAQVQWDLSNQGQFSGFGLGTTGVTHYLEGFTDNISVNHGQTINFKINTDCANYRIDIYRLGYYAGLGARKMTTILKTSASAQPTPLQNAALGLVDAGNWLVTASWSVPATAVSGVYVAHLVRQDAFAGENHIVFVVRDDGTKHDIIFQTSDTTWQAYNGWGGPSLYGNAANSDGRAYKVSYNRPFATRDSIGLYSGPQDFVFGVEIAAIRWLEANGYDVAYTTGVDSDRNGALLTNYKVFLSVGHDEYWSGGQRANVEAARGAGVNLAFLSANEVFWKTRWEASTDPSATPYRTLVCYKETRDNAKIDPTTTWTGSWRDPRFSPPSDGGRPENALTGTIWTVDSWRADTIKIPYPMTLLRFWRNTSVAATPVNGTASLVQNYLGYEWDESPDNGFRPPGLIHLSSTTLPVSTYMIDYGLTDGAYTATHNLALYRYPGSGALVFGAGTVFWAWGLDPDHDLQDSGPETDINAVQTPGNPNPTSTTPVDPNVKQATVNLLADMGVQPQTIQSGLVLATKSTDVTPPVSTISPISTAVEQQIVVITGTATDVGGRVAGVEVSTDGGVSWHPANGTSSWTYSWWPLAPGISQIQSRAVDDSLNLETPSAGISVTVTPGAVLSFFNSTALSPYGLGNAPVLVGPIMDNGAVELGVKFQTSATGTVTALRFYKNPWNTGTHVGNLWNATGTLLGSATFVNETAYGWQQVSLATPVTLAVATTYIVSYHSNAGNYSCDQTFFTNAYQTGPLRTVTTGGTGVYAYGSSSIFPSNSGGTANYWADLVFNRSGGTGNQAPTANNDSGFVATMNTPLTLAASALLANDVDPNGYTLAITGVSNPTNGAVSYNSTAQTVTFTPTTGYPSPNATGAASFNYAISNGNGGTATGLVSLTVSVPTSSLFTAAQTPGTPSANDSSSVELGVKFQTTSAGKAIGVRFYKGPQNTGSHVGTLWSSAGASLASVTFTNETASGWQQAVFSSPVTLTVGTTYVVSYHTTSGFYSVDSNYFATALTNGPLTAPSSAASGGNGVYAYGSTTLFPTGTYGAANYWVDILFAAAAGGPPTANNDSGFTTTNNTPLAIPASAVLANDSDPSGYTLSVTGVSSPTNGTVAYDSAAQVITFTPVTTYTGPATFSYSISNGHGGTASASVALTITASALSLFSTTSTPATVTVADGSSVELGLKFQTSAVGKVVGFRFYKGPQNVGTHVGNLWSSTGSLLGSATFINETPSGWQQVFLATPVALTVGTTYVVSYHTTTGFYSANGNYFASSVTNGPLTGLSSAASGGNGVYLYGSTSALPTGTYNATNYWVDILFSQGS